MNGSKQMQQSTERPKAWESIQGIRNIAASTGKNKCDAGSLDNWNVRKLSQPSSWCLMWTTKELEYGYDRNLHEATKQQSTEHTTVNNQDNKENSSLIPVV